MGYTAYGDLAFNNGHLYLAANGGRLVRIDLSNGAVGSVVGPFGFSLIWGLDTDANGELFGFSGTQVVSINTATGAGTLVFDYQGRDIQRAYGASSSDAEPSPSSPKIVYLLLHGTNSDPSTWNTFVGSRFGKCLVTRIDESITEDTFCYRHEFKPKTVNGFQWLYGDGSTFDELGDEVLNRVQEISRVTQPDALILVGHSRGGLAARSYLQQLTVPPPFKLGLLTIGTPHQGTPMGRIVKWMQNEGFTVKNVRVVKTYERRSLFFSPSVRDQATEHNRQKKPIRNSISNAIWSLNDSIDRLDDWVSTFGVIYSHRLRLGENACCGGFDRLDLLDDFGVFRRWLIPGRFEELREFILRNTGRIDRFLNWTCTKNDRRNPNNWACNGDGIAPTISQRLDYVPGFSAGGKLLHQLAIRKEPHTKETERVTEINLLLNKMHDDLK